MTTTVEHHEAHQLRDEPAAEPPMVLIMIESDPDHPDELLGEPFLICPYDDCDAEDEIKQVELVEYWNPVRVDDSHEAIVIGDGNGDDSDDQGYKCVDCFRPVSFPANLDHNRRWS